MIVTWLQTLEQAKRIGHEPQNIVLIRANMNEGNLAAVADFVIDQGHVPPLVVIPRMPIVVLPPHPTVAQILHHTLPPNRHFFSQAQPRKVHRSAPFALDEIHTKFPSVEPKTFGMEQRHGVARTTKDDSSLRLASYYATIGTAEGDARHPVTINATNAPDAETRIMELKAVLELRRSQALTPYNADAWDALLRKHNLLNKYPNLANSLRWGFDAGIRQIYQTATPFNGPSLHIYSTAYQQIVEKEFECGRYIGPCSRTEVESLIGPFQSSPLSLVPKPGKPGKFRAVHNFSHPHLPSTQLSSINYTIDSNMYPCTWGTFATICYTIHNLPPGSQASIRDVAEAYRTIPITPNQWPGLVVKLHDDDSFAINTNNNFGLTSAGGIYGELGDAAADIFRAHGIGPLSKWVDDHIFFRIRCEYLSSYNAQQERWHKTITNNGGRVQSGSRFLYHGETLPNDLPAEFDEDAANPIQNHSNASNRSTSDSAFTYCDIDIDALSDKLGIPWEPSKTIPFGTSVPYLGFIWELSTCTVSISKEKKAKYKAVIEEWLSKPIHTLEDVQKLYGKLLHASLIVPAGRAYLTKLEAMLGSFATSPFVPRHPPRNTSNDLRWWLNIFNCPEISRSIPGPCIITDRGAFSDASSGIGIGIVIAGRWRAWRLIHGWKTEARDIGWAEAVGFELLVRTLVTVSQPGEHFRVFGDNRGVVEGWWKGRSRNKETNLVFRRIHDISSTHQCTFITRYVTSKENPADGPSRGIYPTFSSLLPAIPIPKELQQFIVDYDCQSFPSEHSLPASSRTPHPLQKPARDHTCPSPPDIKFGPNSDHKRL